MIVTQRTYSSLKHMHMPQALFLNKLYNLIVPHSIPIHNHPVLVTSEMDNPNEKTLCLGL